MDSFYIDDFGVKYTPSGKVLLSAPNDIVEYVIPDGVEAIHSMAFYTHLKLISLTIPKSVVVIGKGAISSCLALRNLSLNSTNFVFEDGALYNSDKSELISYLPATTDKIEFEVPSSVCDIVNNAFSNCSALKSIYIPKSVTFIGKSAFSCCASLTELNLPDSVEMISEYAFRYCDGLREVTIPRSVVNMGLNAFDADVTVIYDGGQEQIDNIEWMDESGGSYSRDGKRLIDYYAPSPVEEYAVRDGVEVIEDNVFEDCCNLRSVSIPRTVKKIGDEAFKGSSVFEIIIPDSVVSIGSSAFEKCLLLKSIILSKHLDVISSDTFNGCLSLTYIDIPSSVVKIFRQAFLACENLKYIELPEGLEVLGAHCFNDCHELKYINIPSSCCDIGDNILGNSRRLRSVKIDSPHFLLENGVLYNSDKSRLIQMLPLLNCDKHFVVPDSVNQIGGHAFYGCGIMEEVTIHKGVEKIEYVPFMGCAGLRRINILGTPHILGGMITYGCKNLEHIIVPKGASVNIENRYYEDWEIIEN